MKEETKESDPRGTPRIWISEVGISYTFGIGHGRVEAGLVHDHSHFKGLRNKPKSGPFSSINFHIFNSRSVILIRRGEGGDLVNKGL